MIWIELFLTFLKIGAFTFGGGYAMLPLIQSEVEGHGWLTQAEVVNFIAVSESTPGPLAINMATFVGIRTGGVFGAVCATLGVVLPSFVIILIVAKFYEKFRKSRAVDGVMYGLRPAVIGLIGAAFLSVGMTVFFPNGLKNSVFSGAGFWLSWHIRPRCCACFQKAAPNSDHRYFCCYRYYCRICAWFIILKNSVSFSLTEFMLYDCFTAVQSNELVAHDLFHQLKCRNARAVTAVKYGIKL